MRRYLVVAALVLTGCAMVGPDYQRPDTGLPEAYGEPAPAGGIAVPQQWWKLYNDPLLDELVSAGLERNADVKGAMARVEEAEAALREARATLFFPLVEGEAGASRSRVLDKGTSSNFNLGASTSFEIDLWGRLRRSEAAIREQLLASRYGRDTVSLTLAAAIARTYFGVRSLDAQLAASNGILKAADESVAIAKKRLDAGVASALDVYQAGSLRTTAAAQAKEVARQRAVLVHQLGVLTGKVDLVVTEGDLFALPVPPLAPSGLPSELLQRRPDVREAEANLAAATQRIGVARASQFPALSLTASLGLASGELSNLFSTGSRVWSVGANVLGPILDGGRYAARTAQAEARARQAEAAYQRAVQNAFRDVSDALSNGRLAAELETDYAQKVDVARAALRLALLRYDSGYSAYLEVLDAQRTLNDAQLGWIRNRQAYLAYTVDLMNSLGGGWTDSTTR